MIKDDTKQTFKFLMWLLAILVLLYFFFVIIFYKAGNPERNETRELQKVALQKTPIKYPVKDYHLNRGVNSYALKGTDKNHTVYYFIYLPGSKKGYLLPASEGVSESTIRNKYSSQKPNEEITEVNLGWYQGKAVWEVSSRNSTGRYNYQLYEFKNGNLLS